MSDINDFVIKDGVLIKYVGKGEDVVVPSEITKIADEAFYKCNKIKTVILPEGIACIGNSSFKNCTSLNSINFPSGLQEIRSSAFEGCISLKSVELPKNLSAMAAWAFKGCTSLQSVTFPDGEIEMGGGIFENCSSLTNVMLPANGINSDLKDYGVFHGCDGLIDENGLIILRNTLFECCTNGQIVTIPKGVTNIWPYAFYCCTNLRCVVAPDVSIENIKTNQIMFPATVGYISKHELYTDENIMKEYKKYASSQKKKLLKVVLGNDNVKAISWYAENGIITKKNFETDFLNPAMEANATQCVAYLLNWKNENI